MLTGTTPTTRRAFLRNLAGTSAALAVPVACTAASQATDMPPEVRQHYADALSALTMAKGCLREWIEHSHDDDDDDPRPGWAELSDCHDAIAIVERSINSFGVTAPVQPCPEVAAVKLHRHRHARNYHGQEHAVLALDVAREALCEALGYYEDNNEGDDPQYHHGRSWIAAPWTREANPRGPRHDRTAPVPNATGVLPVVLSFPSPSLETCTMNLAFVAIAAIAHAEDAIASMLAHLRSWDDAPFDRAALVDLIGSTRLHREALQRVGIAKPGSPIAPLSLRGKPNPDALPGHEQAIEELQSAVHSLNLLLLPPCRLEDSQKTALAGILFGLQAIRETLEEEEIDLDARWSLAA